MSGPRKTAVVTGASQGIGAGIVKGFVERGFNVVANSRKVTQSTEVAASDRVALVDGHIGEPATAARIVETALSRFKSIDALVNNAGIAPKVRADILDATEESFEQLVHTNLQGPYFLTQAAARWMIEQKQADAGWRGGIVNVSSISATVASVNRGDYCISKAGIAMATQLWAARLGEFDIPVYEVRPGVIKTDMTSVVTEKYDKLFANGLAIQARWGLPEDVGKAVAALARGDFPYSTGQVVMVDGGLTMQRL